VIDVLTDTVDIWCPFEVRQSSVMRADDVERQLIDWAQGSGLIADGAARVLFEQARFGEFASLVYPDAPDPLCCAKWLAWLFVVDDRFDERHGVGADGIENGAVEYMPLPGEMATPPSSVVTRTLTELWRELTAPMPLALQRRFRYDVSQFLRSYGTQIACDRSGRAPALDSYVDLRRHSGAVETCIDLIERRPQAYLAPRLCGRDEVLALRKAANDIICWSNDVMSLAKEILHGELNNLVAVLRASTDMGWKAAAEVAAEMIAARTREFDEISQELLRTDPSASTAAFVDGLTRWIAGSLDWHRRSPRYTRSIA
jgi:hypothetical protein